MDWTRLERLLRTLHGWLGALLLPWVVIIGATGIYMNHRTLVLGLIPEITVAGPDSFAGDAARPVPGSEGVLTLAARLVPDAALALDPDTRFEGREVWTVKAGQQSVIIDRATGYTWVQGRYSTAAYAPDGSALGTNWRWSRILASLHGRGWVGTALGSWLADITATALVLFGLSGLVLFWAPRLRRRRNRRLRMQAQRS